MKRYVYVLIIITASCNIPQKASVNTAKVKVIEESNLSENNNGTSPGIAAYNAIDVNYKRENKSILEIQLAEPVVIGVASRPEKWGFFQFPKVGRKTDGTLLAKWHMATDAIESYGSNRFGSAASADEGKSWKIQHDNEIIGGLLLPNGDQISIKTPTPIKAEDLKLPKPIATKTENYPRKAVYTFYRLHDLPESCQGVYINRLRKGDTTWKVEKATVYDPQAARYELKGLLPILWSGDLHLAPDGSIIAGIYPGFYIKEDGNVEVRDGIFFYRSTDNGASWKIHGRILYTPDLEKDPEGNNRMGFMEPGFEILSDGTFICVMRTSDGLGDGPMYASYSKDMGVTWSKPSVIASAGVSPAILELENGVIALTSGRPGVQLRFSSNKNQKWTHPFEMIPYTNAQKDNISWENHVSCGYTGLLAIGPDRFLMIYSDFTHLNEAKEARKAIKIREVIVKPKTTS